MTPTVLPTPGWLAKQAAGYGQETLLALLAAGLLIASTDGDPEEFYRGVADLGPFDLPEVLGGVFAQFRDDYGYLEHTGPLLDWLTSDPSRRAGACRLAGILADVDIEAADKQVGGDLLGRVYDEMVAINRRLPKTLEIHPVPMTVFAGYAQRDRLAKLIADGKAFADLACLSGVRAVGAILAARLVGLDADRLRVHLRDPDPNWVAIAAINLAIIGHRGEATLEVGPAVVQNRLDPDRFFMQDVGEAAAAGFGVLPDGVQCIDYELALAEANARADLIELMSDALHAQQFVRDHELAGKTLNEVMAELAAEEGGLVDDTAVDFGPRRATRPRVKGRKRVRGKRR